MNEEKETIGSRIRKLRKRQGYTQQDLAKKLRNANSTVAMYEQGNREPSIKVLIKLTQIFNCSFDYLLGGKEEITKINTIKKTKARLQQILELANGLSIQEANYLIKILNKSKIQIEKESEKYK